MKTDKPRAITARNDLRCLDCERRDTMARCTSRRTLSDCKQNNDRSKSYVEAISGLTKGLFTVRERSIDVCSIEHHIHTCIHTSDIARRQHLRSAGCHQLIVPRHRHSTFGRGRPGGLELVTRFLRDSSRSFDSFRRNLKTVFSRFTSIHSALGALRLCTI